MKTICTLIFAAALVLTAADTNVTGNWTGSFDITRADGSTSASTATLQLVQKGAEITGRVGPNESDLYPISKGKIEGNKVSLQVAHTDGTVNFELTLADNHLLGEASMQREGQVMKVKVDVTKSAN